MYLFIVILAKIYLSILFKDVNKFIKTLKHGDPALIGIIQVPSTPIQIKNRQVGGNILKDDL